MPALIYDRKGLSIIFAVFTLLLLSVLGITLFTLISGDIENAAARAVLSRALYIAEAGVQIGAQAIRDDVDASVQTGAPEDNGYHAEVYLEGYQSYGVADGSNASFHGTDFLDQTPSYATLTDKDDEIGIYNFQQRYNLIGTRLQSLEIAWRAIKSSGGGRTPRIRLQYSTDGGAKWSNIGSPTDVDDIAWEAPQHRSIRTPKDGWIWSDFVNLNFRIRAIRTNAPGGPDQARECWIDWLALRATVEVDALTEPQTFAQQVAGYSNFDTVEEIMQLQDATKDLYDKIKDYVTVYSWVNNKVTRPTGARAPVNINTADAKVLRAIFRTTLTDVQANVLTTVIVGQRGTAPFTHMCSTYAYHTTDHKSLLSYLVANLGGELADDVLAVAFIDSSNENETSLQYDDLDFATFLDRCI